MAGNTATPGRTVTSRVLAILAAFDTEHRVLPLSEIARRADLALTTTHRLTSELAAWGALVREPSGDYAIGARIWELGLIAPVDGGLRRAAAPVIREVHASTGATVHLGVRERCRVLFVSRETGPTAVQVRNSVGSRLPLHTTSVGKVLLAHAPQDVASEALRHLDRVTPYTVTQPGRLARQLRQIRADGYATAAEEMDLGAYSVAVPVVDGSRRVRAALGVVIAEPGREPGRYVDVLTTAARGIASQLV